MLKNARDRGNGLGKNRLNGRNYSNYQGFKKKRALIALDVYGHQDQGKQDEQGE